MEGLLPAALQDALGPSTELIEVREEPASDPASIADTLPTLQWAMTKRKRVRVRYDSYCDRKIIDVVIHPYRLAFIRRGWYLVGWCEPFSQVRTFKIERIVQLKVSADAYRVAPEFILKEYLGNAWLMIRGDRAYHVKVRFLAKVAGNVDEIVWHKTQRTKLEEDGSLLFEADVDGLDEIAWWILGYGDQAEVLEPAELRVKIAGHARRMIDYYNGSAVKKKQK